MNSPKGRKSFHGEDSSVLTATQTEPDIMKITPDHWLEGAIRLPYPPGPPMEIRRFGVVHFTDGATAKSSADFWRTPAAKGAEAHIIIDRDGTIYQIRPFNQQCDHAGESAWTDPKTGITYVGLNRCSIGIENANGGFDDPERDAFDWAKKNVPGFKSLRLTHKNEKTPRDWEAYPEAQIAACIAVGKAITERYKLDDFIGHEDIAPKRKVDPGPAFPMDRFRKELGFNFPIKPRRI